MHSYLKVLHNQPKGQESPRQLGLLWFLPIQKCVVLLRDMSDPLDPTGIETERLEFLISGIKILRVQSMTL